MRWRHSSRRSSCLVLTSPLCAAFRPLNSGDRKSTRLNSSHRCISYAVFCLKKKKNAAFGRGAGDVVALGSSSQHEHNQVEESTATGLALDGVVGRSCADGLACVEQGTSIHH